MTNWYGWLGKEAHSYGKNAVSIWVSEVEWRVVGWSVVKWSEGLSKRVSGFIRWYIYIYIYIYIYMYIYIYIYEGRTESHEQQFFLK